MLHVLQLRDVYFSHVAPCCYIVSQRLGDPSRASVFVQSTHWPPTQVRNYQLVAIVEFRRNCNY